MNFPEWHEKYYPNETKETLHKMSHAWASGHLNMLTSQMNKDDESAKKSKVKGRFKVVEFREIKVKKPKMHPSYEEAELARRKLQLEEDNKIFVVKRK